MDADANDRTKQPVYQAYLVRMWRDSQQGDWRASAQSVEDGEINRFGTVQALLNFLNSQANEGEKDQPPDSQKGGEA